MILINIFFGCLFSIKSIKIMTQETEDLKIKHYVLLLVYMVTFTACFYVAYTAIESYLKIGA